MSKETDDFKSFIPETVLANIRSQEPSVLRKIYKQLRKQDEKRAERQLKDARETPQEELVKLLRNAIRKGEIEIRSRGGSQKVSETFLETKTAVSIICPDFETIEKDGTVVYKPNGRIRNGIGLTGQRLLTSFPLIESIAQITEGLELFVIHQASAEEVINKTDIENIKLSSEKMAEALSFNHSLAVHVMVLDSPELIERARQMSHSLIVTESDVERLTFDREEIIKMRLGKDEEFEVPLQLKHKEAAFDIATHQVTEIMAREMIGKESFVHLSVDSARFSEFYENPAISVGRNIRYKGD